MSEVTADRADTARSEPPSRLSRLNDIFELFVKIGLIAAGFIAIFQYLESKQDKRVERTLAYAARFEEPPALTAQQTLTGIFRDQARVAASLGASGITGTQAHEQEVQFVEYLRSEANGSGVEQEIDIIVGFMDNVNNCVTAGLCDAEVASNYFGPFATQLFENLRYYIADMRRRREADYADGLESLAGHVAESKR